MTILAFWLVPALTFFLPIYRWLTSDTETFWQDFSAVFAAAFVVLLWPLWVLMILRGLFLKRLVGG